MTIDCPWCAGDGLVNAAEQMRLARPLNRGQSRGQASSNFTRTDGVDGGLAPCLDCEGAGRIYIGVDGSDAAEPIDVDDIICRAIGWAGGTALEDMAAADSAAEADRVARIVQREALARALTAERERDRALASRPPATPPPPPPPTWPDVERRQHDAPPPDIAERRRPLQPAARDRIRAGRARARAAMAERTTPDQRDDQVRAYMTDPQHRRLLRTQAEARDELARRRLLRGAGIPFLLWTEAPTFAEAVIYCAAYHDDEQQSPQPGGTP